MDVLQLSNAISEVDKHSTSPGHPAYITPALMMSINNTIDLHTTSCRELLLNNYLTAIVRELSRKGIITGAMNGSGSRSQLNYSSPDSISCNKLLESKFIVDLTLKLNIGKVTDQIALSYVDKITACWLMTKKVLKSILTLKDYYLIQGVLEEPILDFKNNIDANNKILIMQQCSATTGGRFGPHPLSVVGKHCYEKTDGGFIATVTNNHRSREQNINKVKFCYPETFNENSICIPVFGLNYSKKQGHHLVSLYHVFGIVRNTFLYLLNLILYKSSIYLHRPESKEGINLFNLCCDISSSTKMDRRKLLYKAAVHMSTKSNMINMDRTGLVLEDYKKILKAGLVFKNLFVDMIDPRGFRVSTKGGNSWETLRSQLSYKKFARFNDF